MKVVRPFWLSSNTTSSSSNTRLNSTHGFYIHNIVRLSGIITSSQARRTLCMSLLRFLTCCSSSAWFSLQNRLTKGRRSLSSLVGSCQCSDNIIRWVSFYISFFTSNILSDIVKQCLCWLPDYFVSLNKIYVSNEHTLPVIEMFLLKMLNLHAFCIALTTWYIARGMNIIMSEDISQLTLLLTWDNTRPKHAWINIYYHSPRWSISDSCY